jgi:hypothetical protein
MWRRTDNDLATPNTGHAGFMQTRENERRIQQTAPETLCTAFTLLGCIGMYSTIRDISISALKA